MGANEVIDISQTQRYRPYQSDILILQDLLDASADYALKAHNKGEYHSTQEVMDKLGKDMGWM